MTARLVLSFGDLVLRSFQVDKPTLSIGRRPYNDIALDDLTVSGEHAVVLAEGSDRVLKDLDSRNGTLVNGRPVHSHVLSHADLIEVGIYRLRYLLEQQEVPAQPLHGLPGLPGLESEAVGVAMVEWLTGPQRGAGQPIDRPIVPIHGAGNQVAVISRRRSGYFITHLEGLAFPLVNGESIGLSAHPLVEGDLIELSGTMLRFRLRLPEGPDPWS